MLTALPQLVKNPYFLVKVKLVELLSEISYVTVEYINGGSINVSRTFYQCYHNVIG